MAEPGVVAYVLKGYPRLSELFIASEIHRLEQAGLELRLYVLRPPDEPQRHDVVERIRATPEYLPAPTSLSGTTLPRWLARNLPRFLPALGRTACRRPLGLLRAAAAAAAQTARARESVWSRPPRTYVKELLQAVALADRVLQEPRVHHLHAHFAHGTTTVTWLASRITGLPFSFTGHAKDVYSERLNPGGLLRRKLEAASFAVTCTEANRRHLQQLAPGATVHRIYHGLNADLARLLGAPPPAGAGDGALRLLGVGRLVEKKGFDVLVEATALLVAQGVDVRTRIVGEDGEQAADVRRRIAARRLEERVTLVGPVRQDALLGEYLEADVLCIPCRVLANGDRDGIPNVLVEAMACGVPVVTTPVSGIPELVADGENGLLVPPNDAPALARALSRLHADADLARRLAEAGRATVRTTFDGDALAGQLAALFAENEAA